MVEDVKTTLCYCSPNLRNIKCHCVAQYWLVIITIIIYCFNAHFFPAFSTFY